MDGLVPITIFIGLLAFGGLTDIVLHKKKDKVLIALDLGLWASFFYLMYLIGA